MNVNPRTRHHGDDHAALPASGSIPFSEMSDSLDARHPLRRFRGERSDWRMLARIAKLDPAVPGARAYLVAHPEREIAVSKLRAFYCEACDVLEAFSDTLLSEAVLKAIAAAHAHNAARHPRRWLRSQHGEVDPSVALDEARRVTSWGADA